MKKFLALIAIISVVALQGCGKSELEKMADDETVYTYSATLAGDVTTAGSAKMVFKDGGFKLKATFAGLPTPDGTDFYEGWILVDGAKAVSTGKVNATEGVYVNLFNSDTDYSSYDKYILTLEPDDANPEPSDKHILEGEFALID